MWNPFKAIGSAIANAGKATGHAIASAGKAIASTPGAVVRAVKAPFTKEKAPPAPSRPATTRPAPRPAPRGETRVMPTVKAPAAPPSPPAGKKLPPSMVKGGGRTGGPMQRDEGILGADSDQIRDLNEAVKEFEADNGILGLNKAALDFLAHPSFSAIFDKYTTGAGFSTEQWIAGMNNVQHIRIQRILDHIEISFDGDFVIDDYDLGGRSPSASF